MKKIGVLTFHRATNYGAVLQTYSLITKLKEENPEYNFEIIDYSTRSADLEHKKAVLSYLIKKGIIAGIDVYKKNKMFKKFSNSLPLSRKKIISDNIKDFILYVNNNYSGIIVGSDAIFNWNHQKFPTAYLLGAEINLPKMSYAASAHHLFYKGEEKYKIEFAKNALLTYKYIGVRDGETEKFVNYCCDKVLTHHNCDPTFLLDMEKIHKLGATYKDKLESIGIDPKKPIILVMTPDEKIGKLVMEKYSKSYNVVSLFIYNDAIPKRLIYITPFEWASIFQCAHITITEYFHATILSLLNKTPVISIDRLHSDTVYEGKIKDLLLKRLQLEICYINDKELQVQGYNLIDKKMKSLFANWSEEHVTKMINKEATHFIGFNDEMRKIM